MNEVIFTWKWSDHSLFSRLLLGVPRTIFLFLFHAILHVLLDEDLVERLFAVLALDSRHLLLLKHIIDVGLLFALLTLGILLLLFLLDGFNGGPKVLRCGLPVLAGLVLVETSLALSHPHFLLLLDLGLFGNRCLTSIQSTCSLETRFASELNSFLLDINTNLHAFACFSKAFLLNLRPHPSGHITRSFSLSGGKDSSAYYSRIGRSSCGFISCFDPCFSILGGSGGYSLFGGWGGGSSRLGSSLGASLAMRIRFCNGILGGSFKSFFSSSSGSSLRKSLRLLLG
jgi:hypothetical protein